MTEELRIVRSRTIAVIILVALVAAGGGYLAGTRQATGLADTAVGDASTSITDRSEFDHRPMDQTDQPPQSGVALPFPAPDPNTKFTHFRVGDRNVKQLLPDGDVIWVGTSGGVVRYDITTDKYRLFDLRSGLLARGIFHLSKLDGRLVAGTYGGGMSIYNEPSDSWDNYNVPNGMGDAFVYDVLEMENGDLWIATWSGANRVVGGALDDREAWEIFTVENTNGGLPNDWVYGLAKGKNGELWLATEGGLARFNDGAWSNWDHADGQGAAYELVKSDLQFDNDPARVSTHHQRQKTEMGLEDIDVAYNPNYIVALLVDDAGVVWSGTWGGGLARFDGDTWVNYTTKDGLPANHIFSLHRDPDGVIWVGTSNGLARMRADGFDTFGVADGLFSNIVFSMATAADGSRWIGSYGGVARVVSLP